MTWFNLFVIILPLIAHFYDVIGHRDHGSFFFPGSTYLDAISLYLHKALANFISLGLLQSAWKISGLATIINKTLALEIATFKRLGL